jgi:hypothetical protein
MSKGLWGTFRSKAQNSPKSTRPNKKNGVAYLKYFDCLFVLAGRISGLLVTELHAASVRLFPNNPGIAVIIFVFRSW